MMSVVAIDNRGDKSYYSQYGELASIAAPGGDTTVTSEWRHLKHSNQEFK